MYYILEDVTGEKRAVALASCQIPIVRIHIKKIFNEIGKILLIQKFQFALSEVLHLQIFRYLHIALGFICNC